LRLRAEIRDARPQAMHGHRRGLASRMSARSRHQPEGLRAATHRLAHRRDSTMTWHRLRRAGEPYEASAHATPRR